MKILLIFILVTINVMAQKAGSLPYYELPEYSESFTAGTVASRLIDGLGFRF